MGWEYEIPAGRGGLVQGKVGSTLEQCRGGSRET